MTTHQAHEVIAAPPVVHGATPAGVAPQDHTGLPFRLGKATDDSIQIAVVGDIHEQWEEDDNLALEHLGINLVLFVGDFGNEAVEVVRRIAAIEIPKAAIMGNHDAWYTASAWGRKKCPYDQTQEDRVRQQLDLLGEADVGYGKRDFPELNLSVVGSRPFSWGGPEWRNKEFLRDRFGVTSFEDSTTRIVTAAQQTASETVLFLGHNGPSGLGDQPEASCGRDWHPLGGDHGDPDLTEAIAQVRASGKQIPLVTFGHMHHRLRHTQTQIRTAINQIKGTIYLNAASVPRIIEKEGQRLRNFSLVSLQNGVVSKISLIWVRQTSAHRVADRFEIASEQILYHRHIPQMSLRSHH